MSNLRYDRYAFTPASSISVALSIRYIFDERLPSNETDTEQVLNTIAALTRRGVEVELVIPEVLGREQTVEALRSHYDVDGEFRLTTLPGRCEFNRPLHKLAHSLQAASRTLQPDAIIYTRNLSTVASALAAGHRVVYDHFRPWPDQYPPLEPLLRWAMGHPRLVGVILHSAHTAKSYRRIGIPEARLLVAHNGYEPTRLAQPIDCADARARVGLPPDRHVAVYAGRINDRKGLDIVLEMAAECRDCIFALVGSEGDGPIERAARAHPNVRIYPWQHQSQLLPFLYAADVLLVPPSTAPLAEHGTTVLPMKLYLYLAVGRPILAPRSPDTSELLEDDHNAVLVPPGDAVRAALALDALFEDAPRRQRLGDASRRTALGLTWDARAAKIQHFLERRLDQSRDEPLGAWDLPAWSLRTAAWLYRRVQTES
jgi:glycosyltransferase involved in cell wall biosynthesis